MVSLSVPNRRPKSSKDECWIEVALLYWLELIYNWNFNEFVTSTNDYIKISEMDNYT